MSKKKSKLCLNCGKNKARFIPPFGWLSCLKCTKEQRKYSVRETIEITTGEIREDRKKYMKDILQRQRGSTPSLEYIKAYGTKGFTKEQVKAARNVWGNDYYQDKSERFEKK